jgi:rhodanese-related sulfurtransferase
MFPVEPVSAKMLDYYVGRSDAMIIDLRDRESYRESHVAGAVNIPYADLEGKMDFPGDKMLIFYCDRGGASMAAARQYGKLGWKARSVIGGFEAYRGRNLVVHS